MDLAILSARIFTGDSAMPWADALLIRDDRIAELGTNQAIKGFTEIAAWTARREGDLGIIAPGRRADLTVFEQDLFEVPVRDWPSVDVQMTIVDGELVHQE